MIYEAGGAIDGSVLELRASKGRRFLVTGANRGLRRARPSALNKACLVEV